MAGPFRFLPFQTLRAKFLAVNIPLVLLQISLAKLGEAEREDALNLFESLSGDLSKISEHDARADGIVKGMLAHTREGPSTLRPTNLNTLIDESLNVAFHGTRADAPTFNVALVRECDPAVGELEVFTQEIMRVFLNLIGNAFYAIHQRQTTRRDSDYTPTLKVLSRSLGKQVEVRVRDNGTGIPDGVVDKIFNPRFTTKPTGEGTGLGLSFSYDVVVHQHHGRFDVATDPVRFTEFIITLPQKALKVGFARRASG